MSTGIGIGLSISFGGKPSVWTPSILGSALVAWYTAGPTWCFSDAGTTPSTVTGKIQTWKDRSGNASPSWTQAISANQPTLQAVTGGYGVLWDGVGTSMTSTSWTGKLTTAGTIGIRLNTTLLSSANWTYLNTNTAVDAYSNYPVGPATYDGVLLGARLAGVTPPPSTGKTTQIYTSDGSGWTRYQNGVSALTAAANFGIGATWELGFHSTNRYYGGYISEIVVCNAILSAGQIAQLNTYLGQGMQ